tara:strand:- start:332 stop:505 length:174 start_codon:yes stop_codon:yes gene_type:complete
MSENQQKLSQMKPSHYYIFWGIMTAAVVAGQIYVSTGYRMMAQQTSDLTNLLYQKLK